jgi:PucR family transcriptional regulator, purine catabolism regulatory protein
MITVQMLEESFKQDHIEVIAGFKGIDAPIEYITVKEFDLKSNRALPNGLIMSTFNGFLNVGHIIEHISWLKERGISAIGFHSVVYQDVPKAIVDLANELQMPLFYIPKDIPYHLIFERYNHLLSKQANRIREEIQLINENMLDAVVLEKDTHSIIRMMGGHLNVPVVYLDAKLEMMSSWPGKEFLHIEIKKLIEEQFIDQEKQLLQETQLSKRMNESSQFEINNKKVSFSIVPLSRQQDFYGYLLIGISKERVMLNEIIIKHCVTALILDAVRRYSVIKFQKNEDIKLLEAIINNDSHVSISSRHSFNSTLSSIQGLMIMEVLPKKLLNEAYNFIHETITDFDPHSLVWLFGQRIVCICTHPLSVQHIEGIIKKYPQVVIGTSNREILIQADEIRKLYEQAVISLEIGLERNNRINDWDNLGIYKFIHLIRENPLLVDYDLDVLKPLIEQEEPYGHELIQTLDVYLQSFFSPKESSEKLFVHSNTVKYRISKIQEIYKGIDFTHHETYLLFRMALIAYNSRIKPLSSGHN